jgi:hypothetical protein
MPFPFLPVLTGGLALASLLAPRRNAFGDLERLMGLVGGAGRFNTDTNAIFQNTLAGPGFQMANRSLQRGANTINTSLARRSAGGGVRTGLGDVSRGLGTGALGFGLGQLQGQAFRDAQQRALQLLQMRAGLAGGFPIQQGASTQGILGGLTGASGNLLLQMLLAQQGGGQPNIFGPRGQFPGGGPAGQF